MPRVTLGHDEPDATEPQRTTEPQPPGARSVARESRDSRAARDARPRKVARDAVPSDRQRRVLRLLRGRRRVTGRSSDLVDSLSRPCLTRATAATRNTPRKEGVETRLT